MPFFPASTDAQVFEDQFATRYEEITPFWLVLDLTDVFGPKNVGVSAHSAREAFDEVDLVAKQVASQVGKGRIHKIIAQIEIDKLDNVRVQPYIGDYKSQGVWWPRLE